MSYVRRPAFGQKQPRGQFERSGNYNKLSMLIYVTWLTCVSTKKSQKANPPFYKNKGHEAN